MSDSRRVTGRAGWRRRTLGEALPIRYGKARSESHGIARDNTPVYGSSGVIDTFRRTLTSKPALIIGRKGTVGATYYSPGPCWPIDTVYFTEGTSDSDLRFFKYLLDHLQLGKLDRSTAVPGLSREDYNALEIAVPHVDEQGSIVAEIEKQFSRLDEAVASLKRTEANLKRYKAAVLKAAVEGKLTEDWRKQHPEVEPASKLLERILAERRVKWSGRGKYIEPAGPNSTNFPAVSQSWVWTNIDQLAKVGTGATPKRDKAKYYSGGRIPWVTSSAVNKERVDNADEFITEAALRETNLALYPPGTLLLAMYGEGRTRGKCSELRIHATTNQAIAAIQCTAEVRDYLKLAIWNQYEDLRRTASGGVQPNLNLSLVRSITIPLPPHREQQCIVAEVARRLSVIEELEAAVESNLTRAALLRGAILRKQFR